MRDSRWPDEKILKRIRRLLKAKGRLSESLLLKASGMPSASTIHKHIGSYRQLYERLGYDLDDCHIFWSDQCQRSKRLRRALGEELETLFPNHIAVKLSWRGGRSILRIDDTFMVSILFCRREPLKAGCCWAATPAPAERECVTLICLLNARFDCVVHYYIVPRLG